MVVSRTFMLCCGQVWLFEHEQTTCPACRGQLDASATQTIDARADAAARLAFPREWEARRDAARAASHQTWLSQLPFLLCPDPECARMVRGLGRDQFANVQISEEARERARTAMLTLPRRWFLPPSLRTRAYDSNPVRLHSLRFNVSAPGLFLVKSPVVQVAQNYRAE